MGETASWKSSNIYADKQKEGAVMDSTVVIALIAAGGTIISGIISALISNSITKYRISQLEKKVDKHNSLIERTYKLEGDVTTLQHDVNLLQKGA